MGSRPATALSFSFIRRRRRVSIYQSYIGGWPPASALSFSDVDVGDACQFINHILVFLCDRGKSYTTPTFCISSPLCHNMIDKLNADLCFEIVLNLQPEIGGSPPPSDVGDAFNL